MKSHSTKKHFEQSRLIALQHKAGDKIEELLDHFGIELSKKNKFFVGPCPIHGGSNSSAFNIFHTGDEIIGNWRCFTRGCQHHFQPTIIGFVRGLISKTKYGWSDVNDIDKECPFHEAVNFLVEFTGSKPLNTIDIDYGSIEKQKFSSHVDNIYARKAKKEILDLDRELVISSLDIPAQYYLGRGYSAEILEKYDIGLCTTPNKPMSNRIVVPIYNDDHTKVVGCSGRSIFDACPLCRLFHNPTQQCPTNYQYQYTKWKNNKGFPAEDFLYNYWFAKDFIRKSGIMILVESPGNVWRLEEAGIHNSVGTFGAHLTDGQRNIIDKSGALVLIVLTDPDQAGRLALEQIRESCGSTYTIHAPVISTNDIGATDLPIIQSKLIPFINKVRGDLGYE